MRLRRNPTARPAIARVSARRWRRRALAGLAAVMLPALALAQSAPPAYSADAVYRAPDGSQSTGRVIKSGPDMRLEFIQGDRPVVQIIRRAVGVMYVLDPASQSYYEMRGTPEPDVNETAYAPPCDQAAQAGACSFIGTETTSGITAEIWEMGQPGQAIRILWDGARKRALRQEFPDGSVMAMRFEAMEEIAGRQVEHWSITVTGAGQAPMGGHWYYDPELRVELREELPSGELRSLEHIAVGAVDPALFTVPAGWSQIAPPQAAPSGN
ncbi:hypothetical protein [Sinisalibacter aestuarii]|uniref:DUF4412 domain-containing protein n=1 Tax=Sinisalibacter aestuarii TaxID=2949426 RepID=A0ABQ5LR54_9RHOB|nr:hypothetical protein [Sinisalibacter aestuarii]GKY87497.1 hypothetical protein STA1M1_13660 [Sinisalibacter aestuarii]